MRRIDPNAVAAWFAAHPDIEPVQEDFVRLAGDRLMGCCLLTSQMIGGRAALPDDLRSLKGIASTEGADLASRKLRVSYAYALGLAHGWDRLTPLRSLAAREPDYVTGYKDGSAAYEATMRVLPVGGAS